MAFDARKAWVKKKVMGALKLEDLSLWNSLMARVSLECLRRAFTAAAFPGGKHETQSDFIHLYNSYAPLLEMQNGPLQFSSGSNVQAYALRLCSGPINLTGKGIDSMNRYVLVGLISPHILTDLALILEGFLVPLLSDRPEQHNHDSAEKSPQEVADDGKPPTAQLLKVGARENSAASTYSHVEENDSADSEDSDDIEDFLSSQSSSRRESTSAAEGTTVAAQENYSEPPAGAYNAAEDITNDTASDDSSPVFDPECKSEALTATQELLTHIKMASSRIATPLPMPTVDAATQGGHEGIADESTLEAAVSQWQTLIWRLLDSEKNRKPDSLLPISEVNFWRDRHAAVSLLYEQLLAPQCQEAIQTYEEKRPDSEALMSFKNSMNDLQLLHVESTNNLRFLSTLERYFTTLESKPLGPMADTIASLMDALRMVWITSRHFTSDEQMQGLMERIAYQLEIRVRQEARVEQLLRKEVDEATTVLRQSRDLLETWKAEYFSMRSRLEESECDRRSVLHKRTKLNYWIDNALVGLFDSVSDKIFCENSSEDVLNVVKQFWQRTEELEDDCIMFLDTKFTRLRSALSAFQMLKDFTTTASRPRINVKLGEKFVDILKHFSM
ncbi:hypothetical protein ETH_00027220 [Eimeria tenella]|uniref:Dynein heavy chain tail domain-containing protein n=1 Tax=Eimeria tenella TaxID=5802 RepID=U6KHK3_EIMTE|nr:hypothetical protein ETH_00027220 [Eimeria tenella]CDJ37399.1 hypothetical protein ETH_00027220 [Eimeria tenella]|eukprot:XP_013228237.1 hypothetical protein ETH_00027220 [Eimeria tenella]